MNIIKARNLAESRNVLLALQYRLNEDIEDLLSNINQAIATDEPVNAGQYNYLYNQLENSRQVVHSTITLTNTGLRHLQEILWAIDGTETKSLSDERKFGFANKNVISLRAARKAAQLEQQNRQLIEQHLKPKPDAEDYPPAWYKSGIFVEPPTTAQQQAHDQFLIDQGLYTPEGIQERNDMANGIYRIAYNGNQYVIGWQEEYENFFYLNVTTGELNENGEVPPDWLELTNEMQIPSN